MLLLLLLPLLLLLVPVVQVVFVSAGATTPGLRGAQQAFIHLRWGKEGEEPQIERKSLMTAITAACFSHRL